MHTLIIDEFSMLSQEDLAMIDKRCKQAKPDRQHLPFGGLNVVLCGDPAQLPPVGGRCLWSKTGKKHPGLLLYQQFELAVCLQHIERQTGTSMEQRKFRLFLKHLRNGMCDSEDFEWLDTRSQTNIGTVEWTRTFEGANSTHLYSLNWSFEEFLCDNFQWYAYSEITAQR